MISEHDFEPVPGLPGRLPAGETILWQGRPVRAALARSAYHVRLVAGYFAVLALVALATGGLFGAALTVAGGAAGVALLELLAWAAARSTLYTLTNRRLVLRIGVALPKCVNLPLKLVGAVGLAVRNDGTGDVPVTVTGRQRLGWAVLWPHAQPWRLAEPAPMLRAIPEAARVAALVGRACADLQQVDAEKVVPLRPAPTPMLEAAA